MYSHEIEQLLKLRNYVISVEESLKIASSSQIKLIKYDTFNDTFYISTEDKYNFKFEVRKFTK